MSKGYSLKREPTKYLLEGEFMNEAEVKMDLSEQ